MVDAAAAAGGGVVASACLEDQKYERDDNKDKVEPESLELKAEEDDDEDDDDDKDADDADDDTNGLILRVIVDEENDRDANKCWFVSKTRPVLALICNMIRQGREK